MSRTNVSNRKAAKYRAIARLQYQQGGEIEIDNDAMVSESEFGAYVQAWVWVRKED